MIVILKTAFLFMIYFLDDKGVILIFERHDT